MQLAIRRGERAIRGDQRARVVDPASAAAATGVLARQLRNRSREAPHLPARTEVADARQLRTVHGPCEGVLLAGRSDVLPHLRKADQRRASVGRLPEKREGARFVGRPVAARSHLHRCREEHGRLRRCLTIMGRSVTSGLTFSEP